MRIRGPCEQAERPGGSSPPGRFRGWSCDGPRAQAGGAHPNWALQAQRVARDRGRRSAPARSRATCRGPVRPAGSRPDPYAEPVDARARGDDRDRVPGRSAPPRAAALVVPRGGARGAGRSHAVGLRICYPGTIATTFGSQATHRAVIASVVAALPKNRPAKERSRLRAGSTSSRSCSHGKFAVPDPGARPSAARLCPLRHRCDVVGS
jgi:hypothetical protein